MNSSFKKTALASVIAGTFATAAIPAAEANVMNVSWIGAFTMLNATGSAVANAGSDYTTGSYANGDGVVNFSASTAYGWKGNRTPINGTMSFDTSSGAGVATVTPFYFFGDTPGSGPGTHPAYALGVTFQVIDTMGTMVGAMLFSWNGGGHSVSIVMNAGGMFGAIAGGAFAGGPTSTISGVGALPATDGTNFGTSTTPQFYPLGAAPAATMTMNTGAGCNGLSLATVVNAYTITTNFSALGTCTTGMADDGIGGSPMSSSAFGGFNANFDILGVHFDSMVMTPTEVVPVPAAVWLFGSGLLGLAGIARRKKKA